MHKPLAQSALKNRLGLMPVGLNAIVLRSLFRIFKKFINAVKIVWFCVLHLGQMLHAWKPVFCRVIAPVYIFCCFAVFLNVSIERAFAVEGHETPEFSTRTFDFFDRLPYLSIGLICSDSWFGINAFKLSKNNLAKATGSFETENIEGNQCANQSSDDSEKIRRKFWEIIHLSIFCFLVAVTPSLIYILFLMDDD